MEQPPWIGTFNHQPRTLGIFTACHLDSWFSWLCDSPHPTTCPWSAPSRRGSVVQWFNSLKLSALSCGRRSVHQTFWAPNDLNGGAQRQKTIQKLVTHKGSSVPREKTWVNESPTYLSFYLSLVGGCKKIRFPSRMLGPVVNPSDPEKTGTPMAHCHYKKEHFHKPWPCQGVRMGFGWGSGDQTRIYMTSKTSVKSVTFLDASIWLHDYLENMAH